MSFRKAKRSATKLRCLIKGPSGSGKTYGSLLLAKGLGGRVVVIDTEAGSSDLYDGLADFDVYDLAAPFAPEHYAHALDECAAAGFDVVIIDSISHAWNGRGGCLEIVDDLARAKYRGNSWSAWADITPRWRSLIDAILQHPAHVICTGRSKTETAQVEDNGRKKVAKLGMKLEARDGLEFEFTAVLDLIHDGHYATAEKDRTGVFSGDPKPLTAEAGQRMAEWLAGGVSVERPVRSADFNVAMAACLAADSTARVSSLRERIAIRAADNIFTEAEAGELEAALDRRAASLNGEVL